jgi:hypothetical protein
MDEMSIGGENVNRNFVSFSQYQILGLPPEHFWTSNSNYVEDQSNEDNTDKYGQTSSGSSSSADSQVQMLMPKMPIIGHLPMQIYQQNQTQTIIIKDNKQENSENAKDGLYRNCLVCGENNKKCGCFINK